MAWLIKEMLDSSSTSIKKEEDPNIKDWAKADTKPDYTAEEVGALPAATKIPSKISEFKNNSGYVTTADLDKYITDNRETLKGADGSTPVKGTDYMTDADLQFIKESICRDILGEEI